MSMRLPLLVLLCAAGLLSGACKPLRGETLLGRADAGVPDASVQEDDEPPPDAGSSQCWRTRELVADVQHLAFTFDSEGVGHFAFDRDSTVYVGTTRPGEAPTVLDVTGRVVDLAVDARGQRHLLLDGYPSLYAREQNGSWTYTGLPASNAKALKLDASGFAHVVFLYDVLAYGTNRSGSWQVTVLRTDAGRYHASLALDSRGNVHLANRDSDSSYTGDPDHEPIPYYRASRIYYATNASGAWVEEWIPEVEGFEPVLALDAGDRPHLLYARGEPFSSKGLWAQHLAKGATGVWETLPVGPARGLALDLKADPAGNLEALLDEADNPVIASAVLTPGSQDWRFTPLVPLDWREGTSVRLLANVLGWDAAGAVRIGYWYEVLDSNNQSLGNHVGYAWPCP